MRVGVTDGPEAAAVGIGDILGLAGEGVGKLGGSRTGTVVIPAGIEGRGRGASGFEAKQDARLTMRRNNENNL